ncbi:hypothetical protein Desgi_4366 [Desulfoscipio gibsoniae DSM 7213]|uniref:Uncharacterized protein n=1 Tax=Desulfoscipio gibsoniae DSM 7213 TaxID=767817 RepID=R4KLR4_9FIRM|nr:hypothetical protein Desgi_4366 [Desulfoscipio gibsoniae DSM 7213]
METKIDCHTKARPIGRASLFPYLTICHRQKMPILSLSAITENITSTV